MGFEQGQQFQPLPQGRARHCEKPREAVAPLREVREVAQEHIHQQCRIHLPAHRVGTVAEEAGKLEALLHLLEEDLDVPAAAVEAAHGLRAPREVVGDKYHHPPLPVHLHPRFHPPYPHALVLRASESNELVLDDVFVAFGEVFERPPFHVVLRPSDPLNLAGIQVSEVSEVHVSLVENHNLTGLHSRADLPRALVVVVFSSVHDGKGRQEAVQVEAQVHLGRSLAPAVLGPVHAVGNQLHGGGVHGVDFDFEAAQETFAFFACGKGRAGMLEMRKGGPEEFFDKGGIARLIL